MDTHFTSSPRAQFSCFLKLFIFALGDNAVLLCYRAIKRTSPFEPNTCFPLARMMGKCLLKSLYLSTFLIYKKSLIPQIPRGLVKKHSGPKWKRKGKSTAFLLPQQGQNCGNVPSRFIYPLFSHGVKIQKQVVFTKKTKVTWEALLANACKLGTTWDTLNVTSPCRLQSPHPDTSPQVEHRDGCSC